MFSKCSKGIAKITAVLICLGIFAIAVFQWTSVESIYHFQTQTTQCPISEAQTGCSTFSEHVSVLNSFLIAVLPDTTILSLALLLLLALAATILNRIFDNFKPNKADGLQGKSYIRDNPDLPLFNHLKLAFASGILNPKIY